MAALELTDEERAAFAALVKAVVTADNKVSVRESERLSHLVRLVGTETFATAPHLDAADADGVRRWAAHISRPEARADAYRRLSAAAAVDGLDPAEASFLAVVADAWGIESA